MTVRPGMRFLDLDKRERRNRILTVVSASSEYAHCVSNTTQRSTRIHVSRLLNPALFKRTK